MRAHAAAFARSRDTGAVIGGDVVDDEVNHMKGHGCWLHVCFLRPEQWDRWHAIKICDMAALAAQYQGVASCVAATAVELNQQPLHACHPAPAAPGHDTSPMQPPFISIPPAQPSLLTRAPALASNEPTQLARQYCADIFEVLRTLKRTRDMSVAEVKLVISIEDPRTRERRSRDMEVGVGMGGEDLG